MKKLKLKGQSLLKALLADEKSFLRSSWCFSNTAVKCRWEIFTTKHVVCATTVVKTFFVNTEGRPPITQGPRRAYEFGLNSTLNIFKDSKIFIKKENTVCLTLLLRKNNTDYLSLSTVSTAVSSRSRPE